MRCLPTEEVGGGDCLVQIVDFSLCGQPASQLSSYYCTTNQFNELVEGERKWLVVMFVCQYPFPAPAEGGGL